MNALQLADAIDEMAVNPKGGKMAAIAYRKCANLIRKKLCEPCTYCGDGKYTGLPGNACENCMNTGYLLRSPELEAEHLRDLLRRAASYGGIEPQLDVEIKAVLGAGHLPDLPQTAIDRDRIARAICCPSGCSYLGDSEDGEKCYCDTTDFHGSGIEKKTDAVISALSRPHHQSDNSNQEK